MKSIKLCGLKLMAISIDDGITLLQSESTKHKKSLPRLGEMINQFEEKELIDVVACENELLIYHRFPKVLDLLKFLSTKKLILTKQKSKKRTLAICFDDGMDWTLVESKTGLARAKIEKEILSKDYPLLMYGFRPGFLYLDGLNEKLNIPRLDKPRLEVPAGSVALGGKYIGVYGTKAPAGWHIIGKCAFILSADEMSNNFPSIGERIKFDSVSKTEFEKISRSDD